MTKPIKKNDFVNITLHREDVAMLCGEDFHERIEAIRAVKPLKPEKPFTWKRAAWYGVSSVAGFGLAWFLHKKAPMINHAACAVLGKQVGEMVGFEGRRSAIPGAVFTLGSYWAHDNMPLVAIAAATISHAECIGHAGEYMRDAVVQAKEAKEAEQEVDGGRTETSHEEGSHPEKSHEEASHEQ